MATHLSQVAPTGTPATVRTAFSPSPIGPPSIGLIRAAVVNWALARHHGGRFVLRIEDTDAATGMAEYYQPLTEVLRWLGLDWDEGPGVGGHNGPYLQSERREIHLEAARKLFEAGDLYESFSTREEIEARNRAAGRPLTAGYDNGDRDVSERRKAAYRAEGRTAVLRMRMPDEEIVFDDLVRGRIVFPPSHTPDPVMVRANGDPLFALANTVDNAMMGITHSLRGDDLLSSTPRQLAAYAALQRLGITTFIPRLGHISPVLDARGKKLSRAVPDAEVLGYRKRGFLPEAMVNYLASIGWSHSTAGPVFTRQELIEDYDVGRMRAHPVRLDVARITEINAAHLRRLSIPDYGAALLPHMIRAGTLPPEPSTAQRDLLSRAAPLVQRAARTLTEAAEAVAFLFLPDDSVPAQAGADGPMVDGPVMDHDALRAAADLLEDLEDWTADSVRLCLTKGLGQQARPALGALRVALTGRPVAPPLYETLALLGRTRSLCRMRHALSAQSPARR
ncbi:glutamate--tRNA ligase [Streptomyces gilvosporeus]|uniref:Glutamate--tRNA ligase n=1 Tax=Streptomyces gilvosporeus TaxID=553510 RepID=A0A1V0U1W9_9ACTN|nr:glutamate--tRNA ligase [Streptomyces gilvosporeus]ARF59229.1 glutamate--tRNA ligase [Streptomyces gilvosporeus]